MIVTYIKVVRFGSKRENILWEIIDLTLCVSFLTDALYLSSMAVSKELSSFLPQIDTNLGFAVWTITMIIFSLGYTPNFSLYTQFLFKKFPSPLCIVLKGL